VKQKHTVVHCTTQTNLKVNFCTVGAFIKANCLQPVLKVLELFFHDVTTLRTWEQYCYACDDVIHF